MTENAPEQASYDDLLTSSRDEIRRIERSMKDLRRERDKRTKVIHDAINASGGYTSRWDDDDSKNDRKVKSWEDGLAALDEYDRERGYKVDTIIGPERNVYVEVPLGHTLDRETGDLTYVGEGRDTFKGELQDLINKYSQEIFSNTPDWILASYLDKVLSAGHELIMDREVYYDVHMEPGKKWHSEPIVVAPYDYSEEDAPKVGSGKPDGEGGYYAEDDTDYDPAEPEEEIELPPMTHDPETATPLGYTDIVVAEESKLGHKKFVELIADPFAPRKIKDNPQA